MLTSEASMSTCVRTSERYTSVAVLTAEMEQMRA